MLARYAICASNALGSVVSPTSRRHPQFDGSIDRGGIWSIRWYIRIGTWTLTEGRVAGRMIGASIDSGPSPRIDATPVVASNAISNVVIEKRLATPSGRSVAGFANTTSSGKLQTSSAYTNGCSGAVQVCSRVGLPRLTRNTSARANLRVSIATRAFGEGHI